MNNNSENIYLIQQYVGKFKSFLDVDIFDLKHQSLIASTDIDDTIIDHYREILLDLEKFNLDTLFRLRIAIFSHHVADLKNIANILRVEPLTEEHLKSDHYIKYYLLNSLDFIIYYKATVCETSSNEISIFHQVKEYLFLNEDYRDQLEFFIEMREIYVIDSEANRLQNLLVKEHSDIVSYVKGIYNIYQRALNHFNAIANERQCQA